MKFIEVNELPEYQRATYKHVREELEMFLKMNCKYARVDLNSNDYGNPYSACATLSLAARRNGFPIKAAAINGEIYLIRKDI